LFLLNPQWTTRCISTS